MCLGCCLFNVVRASNVVVDAQYALLIWGFQDDQMWQRKVILEGMLSPWRKEVHRADHWLEIMLDIYDELSQEWLVDAIMWDLGLIYGLYGSLLWVACFCKPDLEQLSVTTGVSVQSGVYLYHAHLNAYFSDELQCCVERSVSICGCVCYKCTFFGECCDTLKIKVLGLMMRLYCWYL